MSYRFADSVRAGSGWNCPVHHQEFFTVLTASRFRMELLFHPDPARTLSTNLYDIYHCCVYSKKLLMVDRGAVRNM